MTITGLLPSAEAVQVMAGEDVDISRHRSSQLTPELIRKADLILAMSPFHRQTALRLSEDARRKTYLLKEFARSDLKNVQIADPMGSTLEVFKKCYKEIKVALTRLMQHDWVLGRSDELKPLTPEMLAPKKTVEKKAAKPVAPKPAKKSAAPKGGSEKPAAKGTARSSTAGKEGGAKPASAKSAPSKRADVKPSTDKKGAPRKPPATPPANPRKATANAPAKAKPKAKTPGKK
jgi:protein-tyrosine-phosphatase